MAGGLTHNPIIIAIVAGIIPTILWLLFWLREDRYQPEPIGLLVLTFIAGALGVFLVFPFESVVINAGVTGTQKLLVFAAAEELVKFGVVFIIDFQSSYLDEPIDYAVYLITGALGFATVENVLFLLSPQVQTNISFILETGILRFIGATILHTILAAILGIIIGFVFYKSKLTKTLFIFVGLGITIILHTIFNYFIIKYIELNGFLTLGALWVTTLIIITLFEKVRNINH